MAAVATDARLDPGRLLLTADVTPGRAVPGDDPCLGLAGPVETPVLLLEPVDSFLAVDPAGRRRELRTEVLVQQGFQRFEPGADPVPVLPGWAVAYTPGQARLCDGTGEAWAYSDLRPGRAWLTAATTAGRVLVVYGTFVGVRAPRGVPAAQYAPVHRAAELHAGRAQGLVAAALVAFRQ